MIRRVPVSRFLCLLPALLCLQACAPPIYFAKATYGTIIDAETKQPIEGAVVVAKWDMFVGGIGSAPGYNTEAGLLRIAETITDRKGEYTIPGWGPKLRSTFWGMLDDHDPVIIVFKSGYLSERRHNKRERNTWIRTSDWNGTSIPLQRFTGNTEARLVELRLLVFQRARLPGLYSEILRERELLSPAGQSLFEHIERLRTEGKMP